MSARELIGKHPVAAGAVAVVIVLLAVLRLMTMGQGGAAAQPGDRWHYDLTTGELFPGSADAPNLSSPAGNPGTLAMVFSCGSCDDTGATQIAYIECYTDQGLALLGKVQQGSITPEVLERLENEHLVSPPPAAGAKPNWLPAARPQARLLMDVESRCTSDTAKVCLP